MATTLLFNDERNNLKIQTSLPPDFRVISFTKKERNMKATLDLSGFKTVEASSEELQETSSTLAADFLGDKLSSVVSSR